MDTVIEAGAGLDVHKETVTANVRYPDERGRRRVISKQFGTTTGELLALSDWLGSEPVKQFETSSQGSF